MIREYGSIFILFHLLFMPSFANANKQEVIDAANNYSSETSECAAFFLIQSGALKKYANDKSKDEKSRRSTLESYKKYFGFYKDSFLISVMLSKVNRTEEMALKVTKSRVNMYAESMKREIDSDFSNISILMDKHLYKCLEILNNPEKKMELWGDKEKH